MHAAAECKSPAALPAAPPAISESRVPPVRNVYMVSGHVRAVTPAWFEAHYAQNLRHAAAERTSRFVLGDQDGVDALAQKFLQDAGVSPERVTVYHVGDKPRRWWCMPGVRTRGGFRSLGAASRAMTSESTADIAWLRGRAYDDPAADVALREHVAERGQAYVTDRVSWTEEVLMRRCGSTGGCLFLS